MNQVVLHEVKHAHSLKRVSTETALPDERSKTGGSAVLLSFHLGNRIPWKPAESALRSWNPPNARPCCYRAILCRLLNVIIQFS